MILKVFSNLSCSMILTWCSSFLGEKKKKKRLLLVFIKKSSVLSSEIQVHKFAICMYFFQDALLCKVDY